MVVSTAAFRAVDWGSIPGQIMVAIMYIRLLETEFEDFMIIIILYT